MITKIEQENKRFLVVFFKKEGEEVKKKVKVFECKNYKEVLFDIQNKEDVPPEFVKETFGQNQKEGIKSIRNMEEFEDDTD